MNERMRVVVVMAMSFPFLCGFKALFFLLIFPLIRLHSTASFASSYANGYLKGITIRLVKLRGFLSRIYLGEMDYERVLLWGAPIAF